MLRWKKNYLARSKKSAQLEAESHSGAEPPSKRKDSIPVPRSILKSDKPTCQNQLIRNARP